MEIYKDLNNPASQEFEKLLNSQLSKTKIEEGKVIEGLSRILKIYDRNNSMPAVNCQPSHCREGS